MKVERLNVNRVSSDEKEKMILSRRSVLTHFDKVTKTMERLFEKVSSALKEMRRYECRERKEAIFHFFTGIQEQISPSFPHQNLFTLNYLPFLLFSLLTKQVLMQIRLPPTFQAYVERVEC